MNLVKEFIKSWNENGLQYTASQVKIFIKNFIRNERFVNNNPVLTGIIKEQTLCGPELVQLDLTNNCNNSCIGCWIHSPKIHSKQNDEQKKKFISTEKILETLIQLKKIKTKTILLSGGGEPFMHCDIRKIIKKIKTLGMRIIIITNFNLVTKKDVKFLVKLGVNELLISLWAATSKTYVATHPNQTITSFEKIKKNLEYLMNLIEKRKIPKVRLLNVLTKKNYHELIEMIKFGEKLGVHEIEFTLIDTIKEKTDQFLLNKKEQEDLKKQINQYQTNGKTNVFGLERFKIRIKEKNFSEGNYDQTLVDSIPCYAGYSYTRIMADGRVIPCCKGHLHPLGNINQKTFKDIWFSPKYEEFRLKAKNLKKNNSYFKKIDCYKGCDNFIENLRIHNLIKNLK